MCSVALDRTPQYWPKIPATAQEKALSEAMLDYWTSFARSGVPRAANAPDWPLTARTRSI